MLAFFGEIRIKSVGSSFLEIFYFFFLPILAKMRFKFQQYELYVRQAWPKKIMGLNRATQRKSEDPCIRPTFDFMNINIFDILGAETFISALFKTVKCAILA